MKFSSPKRFRALRTSKGTEFTSGKISTLWGTASKNVFTTLR
jgi:hypothetical protein